MKSPAHPGRLLKADLDELGISVAAAAQAMGVSRQQLHRIIKGNRSLSPVIALRAEKAIGGSADFWLRAQMNLDLAQARLKLLDLDIKRLEKAA